MFATNTFRGVVHGKTIELAVEPGLPDGQEVTVIVHMNAAEIPEGLVRSAGACADEAEDLDAYLAWNREQRKAARRPIEP